MRTISRWRAESRSTPATGTNSAGLSSATEAGPATLGDALSALLGCPVDVVPEELLSDEAATEVRATAVPL